MTLSRNDTTVPEHASVARASNGVLARAASQNISEDSKHHQLNRFLSKTFHMINNSDPKIAGWATAGDSFIVLNSDEFAEKVLPSYFKHSKFSSFVRQLNFYGFRKIRADCGAMTREDGMPEGAIRFYHEFFQPNRPDLLHKIKRATKGTGEANDPEHQQTESHLQSEIDALKDQLEDVQGQMDFKLAKFKQTLENDYQRRISNLEKAYHEVLISALSPSSLSISPGFSSSRPLLNSSAGRLLGLSGRDSPRLNAINTGNKMSQVGHPLHLAGQFHLRR